ncbi:thioredoxin fold domain-containing protein [Providencia sp. PROV033]|uniref:thioredoxin fold domain-containing protein n=1 Tax=Providencia sp. PROV033 TaxID=2949765 RepID=UPI0023495267|nr:thioredoxin fold domain-containing protein [Providencia sp. PROV033]
MSEKTLFNISTDIHGQHLQVRLNNNTLFFLHMPIAEPYQLTVEKYGSQYTLCMHKDNMGFVRLFTTDDKALADQMMNSTADVLTRMAIASNPVQKTSSILTPKWTWLAPGILSLALAVTWLVPQLSRQVTMPIPATQRVSVPEVSHDGIMPKISIQQVSPAQAGQAQSSQHSLSPEAAAEARTLLAERLKNGATKQEFTIRLSSGHARSLYLFLDPECPNCRIFEPTVQALAEDYNVEIFPVTLIGKNRTADDVIPILCAPPEKRAQMWKTLNAPAAGMLNLTDKAKADIAPAACEAGKLALSRNDLAFELYRMPGTPTVISDDGRMIPLQAMVSDTALQSFLNSHP